MAVSKKMFKKIKTEHVLGIIGFAVLIFALCKYSNNKNVFKMGYTNPSPYPSTSQPTPPSSNEQITGANNASTTYAPYNGVTSASNSATKAADMQKPASNPADLLPRDANNWGATAIPTGDLKGINLLNPSQIAGINTQGSSLRNANLQLRSEPPNPRTNTNCPWNISTIESDVLRKPLEIGTGV